MTAFSERFPGPGRQGRWFATTNWNAVLAARDPTGPEGQQALEELCRSYWYPIYAYLRRLGCPPHDCQDLTQEFLTRLIANSDLRGVDPQRGRFRSFLLGTLKHFLSDERKKSRAQKRGGGRPVISIDECLAERKYEIERCTSSAFEPDQVFERQWALTVLERVFQRLQRRYEERGRGLHFKAMRPFLIPVQATQSYSEVGSQLGMNEGGVKVAVHRMRKEFGEILRDEIANTVRGESQVNEEIQHLIRVAGGL